LKITSISKGTAFKISRDYVTWGFPTMLTAEVEVENSEDLEKARQKLNTLLGAMLTRDIEDMKGKDTRFATAVEMVELDFENHEKAVARTKEINRKYLARKNGTKE